MEGSRIARNRSDTMASMVKSYDTDDSACLYIIVDRSDSPICIVNRRVKVGECFTVVRVERRTERG